MMRRPGRGAQRPSHGPGADMKMLSVTWPHRGIRGATEAGVMSLARQKIYFSSFPFHQVPSSNGVLGIMSYHITLYHACTSISDSRKWVNGDNPVQCGHRRPGKHCHTYIARIRVQLTWPDTRDFLHFNTTPG